MSGQEREKGGAGNMGKLDRVYHSVFVQQGDSQTYRPGGDKTDYVILDEAWGGYMQRTLYSTGVRGRFPGTPEGKAAAEAEVKRIKKEEDC